LEGRADGGQGERVVGMTHFGNHGYARLHSLYCHHIHQNDIVCNPPVKTGVRCTAQHTAHNAAAQGQALRWWLALAPNSVTCTALCMMATPVRPDGTSLSSGIIIGCM
jgi:hypothetical protein